MLLLAVQLPARYHFFDTESGPMAEWISRGYLVLALGFYVLLYRWRPRFNRLLTAEVMTDIVALTLLMHASGGNHSGLGYLLLVTLAAAGLVGQGRLTLFYASLASLALLLEQAFRSLDVDADMAEFTRVAAICIGFFAIAISARLLAQRVVTNEELARQRGEQLNEQLHINQRVIRDMQDGVLVVNTYGQIRQYNPRAMDFFQVTNIPSPTHLNDFNPELARIYGQWRVQGEERGTQITLSEGKQVRIRYLPPAEGGNALIYVEDMDKVQAQARQLKLAALGRLTANMAHEIRNPLAAISHAAELLGEEAQGTMVMRLSRIIGDNTRRLNHIVTEVLELGRRDRASMEAIPLASFLLAFADDIALVHPGGGDILVRSVPDEAAIEFDQVHLTRVLTNLVSNALRYCSGDPGSVRIEVLYSESASRVEIRVLDDGPGPDTDTLSHMFEPFFTTRSDGTGLGLYIARELCEANGGSLEAMPGPGGYFRLMGRSVRLEG
ncbi:MAG: HAMP domain-containing histidine kinase [Proteobacteria bacterium]|nr:HAMP domain-containing histidine kinase [Pseudomonadota bacterium]HQR02842.1 HAMP domain-containing sensor histidine kinase [Rhodocyclaceae bacterium]